MAPAGNETPIGLKERTSGHVFSQLEVKSPGDTTREQENVHLDNVLWLTFLEHVEMACVVHAGEPEWRCCCGPQRRERRLDLLILREAQN
jgi:hypothetical protein